MLSEYKGVYNQSTHALILSKYAIMCMIVPWCVLEEGKPSSDNNDMRQEWICK